MPRFAALLRGVNVGSGNRVPMAEWKKLLGKLGYTDVATLLNSGNAVFTSPARSNQAHADRIHDSLVEALDVDVRVIVKSGAELVAARDENPIRVPDGEGSRLLVGFAADSADLKALADLSKLAKAPARFHAGRHALFLWSPTGMAESPVAKELLGKRGRAITTRNWATLAKLIALTGGQ
jgi:uncharacterized protein (DUF1697 family)